MAQQQRRFRSDASYAAERASRDAVAPFLQSRGFVVVEDRRRTVGEGESQIVLARAPSGETMQIRVRLCWRRQGRRAAEKQYSAAQLRARTTRGDWELTLDALTARDVREGVTHNLLFQRDGDDVVYGALIPVSALKGIWLRQRDVSAALIESGALGRQQKNHAANGDSPTLWLQDDRHPPRSHEVADALWQWDGVVDLARLPLAGAANAVDDTFDDCPGLDYAQLGCDAGQRVTTVRSGIRRDPRVRAKVLERAHQTCERTSCRAHRPYPGFLDVHHILGAEASDRYWTCVAICPSCHREAHVAPDSDAINAELLAYATQFKPALATN